MKYLWTVLFGVNIFLFGLSQGYGVWNGAWTDFNGERCETAIKEIVQEDRATVVDDTPDRLQSTWLSQECEVRAGPEYIIRKYTFFENGTFLLLRHHYAEESCSVATHTVAARGVIRLLSSSGLAPGATEARYQLDHVHIIPLTRQVAHKFEHKVNITCTPQPKWRPYTPQVIYERPSQRSSNFLWNNPTFDSFQRFSSSRKQQQYHGLDCLEPLGINFDELKLVRVQKKLSTSTAFGLGANGQPRVELHLGSLPPNVYSKKTHRSTSLQPTILLRSDTTNDCLVCGAILRGTENSPPLLHEVAALPALLGGSWISSSCESCEGGLWIKRQIQFYSGDMLWTGRWDYFSGPKCINFLYSVTAAGSYIQRAGRQRRHGVMENDLSIISVNEENDEFENTEDYIPRPKRSFDNAKMEKKWLAEWIQSDLAKKLLDIYGTEREFKGTKILSTTEKAKDDVPITTTESIESTLTIDTKLRRSFNAEDSYRHLLQNAQPAIAESFTAMLRGNQRREETTRKPPIAIIPSGNTELDLHVAESFLIAGDLSIAARCGAQIIGDELYGLKVRPLNVWPRNCVKHALESPSTLGLKARIGVNWSGQYTLLLGPRDDSLWEAPLRQCGPTPTHNPVLRAHLRRSLGYRYGLFVSSVSTNLKSNHFLLIHLLIFCCLYKVLCK
ncbi:hypothetical protein PV328_006283 [Microctonus aethiopoides]|uniref:APCDD1 domain-containing protein n=1 Tax=Microctonus aethiopoides TaxID=144406 RepID=A0AA39FP01_9HYME|nr:hypothetical protein PV328_006283 [Microctonus aethiopoides]